MWLYLLKVTVIWGILLLCFELFYKKMPYYKANRYYLLLTLVLGLVLPVLPVAWPGQTNPVAGVTRIIGLSDPLLPVAAGVVPQQAGPEAFNYLALLPWLYYTGAVLMLLASIRDIVRILRKAVYGNYQVYAGHKIFNTGRAHAPFSFFGWIFIGKPEEYTTTELDFILKHEDAHNHNAHWFDILVMQCFIVVFWFHPLLWRIRHLLKLEHEYEADAIAAGDAAYDYGHFLLQQTLLKAPHPIAHSFHYSPIKNRITMLAQSGKKRSWKYVLLVPALFGCALLTANTNGKGQRNRTGDVTTYNGNTFYWKKQQTDTILVQDAATGAQSQIFTKPLSQIMKMNDVQVYKEDTFQAMVSSIPAQFRYNNQSINEYLKVKLQEEMRVIPDSLLRIDLANMVVNEQGKIVYYDLTTSYKKSDGFTQMNLDNDPVFISAMDKVVADCPAWLPAMVNGKPVPIFLQNGGSLIFNGERRAFKAVKLKSAK